MIEYVAPVEDGEITGPVVSANSVFPDQKVTMVLCNSAGYAPAIIEDTPSDTAKTKFVFDSYQLGEDGYVREIYNEVDKTEDEIDLKILEVDARARRNSLLANYDWMAARNAMTGDPIPQNILDYTQKLRDLPDLPNWPDLEESDWPEVPV